MRSLPNALLLAVLLFTLSSNAQTVSSHSNFKRSIQKVIEDFPNEFAATRGEMTAENPQSVEYASLILPDGAEESTITKYSSGSKAIYSWQATILTTEDYEEAAKKYKWLFQQVKGMNITYIVDQYTFRGKFEEPSESRKFTTSTLTLAGPPSPLKKIKLEASLQFQFPEWKVIVLLYEKEKEDDEQGAQVDGE